MANAQQLRELADTVEKIEQAEVALREAKENLRKNRGSEAAQQEHQKAAETLANLRDTARRSGVTATSNEPGSMTITPGTANQTSKKREG